MTFCREKRGAILIALLFMLALVFPLSPPTAQASVVSSDGWEWQNPLPQGNVLYDVWGAAADDVYAVGKDGTILHYNGTNWSTQASGTTGDLNGIWGDAADDIYAVGNGGKILHYDGTNWTSKGSGTSNDLYSIWGVDGDDVFAVGASGAVTHYDGDAWESMTVPSGTGRLYGVWGSATDDVFAVGECGTILQ